MELERIERLEGSVHALGLVLNAVIRHSPAKEDLLAAIHETAEQMQAKLLASHVPDSVREGAAQFLNQWIQKGH